MPSGIKSYSEWQLKKLASPRAAASFLNAALADSPEIFLKALRKVAQANQMSKVAKEAGVQRESLYRALSDEGNPTLDTFTSVLTAVGLRLKIATSEEDQTLVHPPRNLDHEERDTLAIGQRVLQGGPRNPTNQNFVDIAKWSGLNSHGQTEMNEMEESDNEPTLQEALCG